MLEGYAVLGHELDFPVRNLGKTFVVRTDKRRVVSKIRNSVPAEVVSLSPHVAYVESYLVFAVTHLFRFGTVVVIIYNAFAVYVGKTQGSVFFWLKANANAVKRS